MEIALAKLIKILKENNNCLKPFLNADVGIKDKQLRESIMNIGFVPTFTGNINPKPVNSSYLKGIKSIEDFYNRSEGTIKALNS